MEALNQLTPLFLSLFVLFSVVGLLKTISRQSKPQFNYRQTEHLFTPAEVEFYKNLKASVGDEYLIFGKVRVADVLRPERGLNRSHWQTAFNRIAMKHFDFILCDPKSLEVKCAIELDDKTHKRGKSHRRDLFLDEVCEGAGLKLMRSQGRDKLFFTDIERV
ncbi:DUF2726 domain-containing protein [Planctobacterium marinum]|uniref:DUF2726 domain-containing protein n=1 Tax=Planctobacterium marinum TaxID=1631968 RepID=A0AA48HU52_9ALTE|nr:hypothetical protein MACH26_35450 [Planctobacterium marinum]